MATATDEIYVKILTDTNQAIAGMATFMTAIGKVVVALYAFKKIVVDSFTAYQGAEVAEARLAAAIKITGQAREVNVKSLVGFAEALQMTTTYSHEATESAMGLLMQIGNLSEKGVRTAIPILMDYASVMGIDLPTAAEQMGQAIAGGRNMFQKYGISLNETMSASQKFDVIMAGLTDKFGGFEAQLASTTSGQMKILKNQVDELKESLGGMFAQIVNPILKQTLTLLTGEMTVAKPTWSYTNKDEINNSLKILQEFKTQLEGLNEWIDKSPLKAFWYQMFGKNADLTIRDINIKVAQLNNLFATLQNTAGGTAGNVNNLADALGRVAEVSIPGYQKSNPLWTGEQVANPFQSLPGGMGGSGNANPFWQSNGQAQAANGWKQIADWLKPTEAEQAMAKLATAIDDVKQSAAAALGGSVGDLFAALGKAVATGEGAAAAFHSFIESVFSEIGRLMFAAGLNMVIKGDITGLGYTLILAGAGSMFIGGLIGGSNYTATENGSNSHLRPGLGDAAATGSIPYMASGGIVSRPTLAMIGESGPEAVVPLGQIGGGRGGNNTAVRNTTIIVQGSVWAERDLARVVAAAMGHW